VGTPSGSGDDPRRTLNKVLVVLATNTIRDLPTEVRSGPDDGMPRECVLNLDHVDTVAKGFSVTASRPLARRSCTPCAVPVDVATGCG
jgi:mRNA-degrading endonuclease toxin of MazEF toxin-antitoxin module